jgi:hypothetical protein
MPSNFLPNALPLLFATLLGFFTLLKDWKAHEHSIRRYSVLTLLCVALIVGLVSQWYSSKRAETSERRAGADKVKAQTQIQALQDSINSERDARHSDAQQFLAQLSKLYEKVSTLQTDEKTKQLKQEIDNLQESLKAGIVQAPYGNLSKRCEVLGTGILSFVAQRNHTRPDPAKNEPEFLDWYRVNDGQFRFWFYNDAKALQKDLALANVKDRRLDEIIARHENYFADRNKVSPQTVVDHSPMYHLSIESIKEIGERFKLLAAQIPHQ